MTTTQTNSDGDTATFNVRSDPAPSVQIVDPAKQQNLYVLLGDGIGVAALCLRYLMRTLLRRLRTLPPVLCILVPSLALIIIVGGYFVGRAIAMGVR